ncbi:MAG: signal peptidase I [Tenericutes bacterium]|nr:signal peptidase I [Mycoplasmatota bacterium]
MKSTLKKIANIIPYLILLLAFILIVSVVTSVKKGETPTIFGRAVFLVVSPSMEDTIMVGDIIFSDTLTNEFHVGDIITFYADLDGNGTDETVTHRIVSITVDEGVSYYTTKGDNEATNPISDDFEIDITADRIIGKYTGKSGFIGKVYSAIYSGGLSLVFIVIILVFVIIGGMEIFNIIKIISQAKDEKALEEEKDKLVQIELERLRREQKEKEE